jgi:hypothetical protein
MQANIKKQLSHAFPKKTCILAGFEPAILRGNNIWANNDAQMRKLFYRYQLQFKKQLLNFHLESIFGTFVFHDIVKF